MPGRKTIRRRYNRRKTRRGGSSNEPPGVYEERAYSNIVRQIDTATIPDAKIQGMTKIMEFLAKSKTILRSRYTRQQIMLAIRTYNNYYMEHEASLSDKVIEDFQEAYNELHNRIEDMDAAERPGTLSNRLNQLRPENVLFEPSPDTSLNTVRRRLFGGANNSEAVFEAEKDNMFSLIHRFNNAQNDNARITISIELMTFLATTSELLKNEQFRKTVRKKIQEFATDAAPHLRGQRAEQFAESHDRLAAHLEMFE
jgi:hypothetical protein